MNFNYPVVDTSEIIEPNDNNLELNAIEWLGARGTQVTFSGEIFFPSKVPEFLHVLFN